MIACILEQVQWGWALSGSAAPGHLGGVVPRGRDGRLQGLEVLLGCRKSLFTFISGPARLASADSIATITEPQKTARATQRERAVSP